MSEFADGVRNPSRAVRIGLPALLGAIGLLAWEWLVARLAIPPYILPPPSLILRSLLTDYPTLVTSLWVTLKITFYAFIMALTAGVAMAVFSAKSRFFELCLFPYAVVLQVTPVVAIAPLILIWVGYEHIERALLILATIVAFFPILSNATLGLKSVDRGLGSLFELYGAGFWQRLTLLELPFSLPYLLGGMKISGGLALIGAVVAEFVAGSGTGTGLAWRIVEAGNRLNIPRMFAALLLLSLLGIMIYGALSTLEYLMLRRWHESAIARER